MTHDLSKTIIFKNSFQILVFFLYFFYRKYSFQILVNILNCIKHNIENSIHQLVEKNSYPRLLVVEGSKWCFCVRDS